MSQAEIRAQKQREQNERRLSVQRSNAYFSIRSQSDSESAKPNPSTTLKPPQDSGQRTCPPNLPLTTPMSWSEECASPVPYHISRPTLTSNSVSDNISPNIAATTTSTVTCFTTSIAPTTTTNTPVPADCTAVSTARPILAAQAQNNLSASTGNRGKAQEKLKNETTKNAAIQTGMDRYVTIKRKLSPQNSTG
ncbi:PREDICTED: microtubule-associated protein RP/EB family member 1-like, partial [Rhagoletis zephyria]|uniref:microtubule-associated protein RP/EB family member 1-like n=1 Tax=Rhagoletis zephyria TaxID=28612 RepID=UPI00081138B1